MWKWLLSLFRGKAHKAQALSATAGSYVLTGEDSMPRRLRVAFPGINVMSTTRGNFNLTGNAATLTYVQNVVATGALTALWQSVPYNPMTTLFFDNRPSASVVGAPIACPYNSKHTRGAYRPANARVYFGYGDWGINTGLPDDVAGGLGTSACAGFCSMDPLNPGTVTLEQHRWVTDATQVVPSAGDEGVLLWNTTSDKMIVFPLNSFDDYNFLATANGAYDAFDSGAAPVIPVFVSSTQFKLSGDYSANLPVNQRFRLFLDHPSFPSFVPSQWDTVPCWIDCRVTAMSVAAGFTNITFSTRQDIPALTFDRNAKGISFGANIIAHPELIGLNAWRDNSSIYYDPATLTYHCGFLEWNTSTRLFTRRNFLIGTRKGGGVEGFPIVGSGLASAFAARTNGTFVPASVTGRGDEIVALTNSGPDGGWVGAYVYEYNTGIVNLWVSAVPSDYVQGTLDKNQPCLDPVGRAIYTYNAQEKRVYKWDIVTRAYSVVCTINHDFVGTLTGANTNGSGHCCWNADLGMIEVYADIIVFGFGCPSLYLVEPITGTVHAFGNTLPNGERIRGDEFYRAADRTIADGGEFSPDGVEGSPPPNRHVFIGKALSFSKLAVNPVTQVRPVWGDPAATDAAATTTDISVLYRRWGNPVVDPVSGLMFWSNGGHTDYQGMDVHWCDLNAITSNTMTWTQNFGPPFDTFRKRPHVPALSDPVYGGISGWTIYSDGTNWVQVTDHSFAINSSHPTLGLIRPNKIPNGAVVPAAGTYTNAIDGISSWNPTTGNVIQTSLATFGELAGSGLRAFLSDWNPTTGSFIMMGASSSADRLYFADWVPGQPFTNPYQYYQGGVQVITAPGTFDYWLVWLSGNTYLLCHTADLGGVKTSAKLQLWDHSARTLTTITSAAYTALYDNNDENVYMARDPDHGKLWWLKGKDTSPPELYYSLISDPANIVRAPMVDNALFRPSSNAQTSTGHRGLGYFGGYLYHATARSDGYADFWRMPAF